MDNKNMKVFVLLIFILVSLSFCTNSKNKRKVEKALNVENLIIENVKYDYYLISSDYKYPNNTYISFSISKSNFNNLTKQLELNKYSSNNNTLDSVLCIDTNDYLSEKFWSFEGINYNLSSSIREHEKSLNWWKPIEKNKNELYAKYYNDTSKAKIVDCKSKEWTGRILMQYIDSTNLTFILIENMFQ